MGPTDPGFEQWVRDTVTQRMEQNAVPAAAIGVVLDGKIRFIAGFGVKELGREGVVDGETLFQIASQSKMFTGVIVKRLVEEGKLSFQEPITTWLGDALEPEAQSALNGVTLLHLLHHRSGIPNYACSVYGASKEGGRLYWTGGYSEAELLADLNGTRPSFTPGSRFEYSNSGYALVGYLCQRVSGLTYAELLQRYVAQPYGLRQTSASLSTQEARALATPYYPHDRSTASKPSDWGMVTPSSGIASSANDLTRLLARQLEAYRVPANPESEPLMLTASMGPTGSQMTYGLGLFRNPRPGYFNYLHGGNADGYSCAYVFSPEKNAGLVLLSSSGGHWFGQLEEEIYHRMTGEEYSYTPERRSLAQAVFDAAASDGIAAGLALFQRSKDSELFYLREAEMDSVGQAMLGGGHVEDAIAIFRLNAAEFAESPRAHQSLGEAYFGQGEFDLAIGSLERALELSRQDPELRAALELMEESRREAGQEPGSGAEPRWSGEQLAILEQGRRFSAAAVAEDTEALVSVYADEAVIGPPGRGFLTGPEEIRGYWTPRPGRDMLTHASKPIEIVVEGQLAYDWGLYEGSSRTGDGPVSEFRGKYLIVWRKSADGAWRMVHDMWN